VTVGPLLSIAALFFFLAGVFVVPSAARKGPLRYLADRSVRLLLPVIFYDILLAPLIFYIGQVSAC